MWLVKDVQQVVKQPMTQSGSASSSAERIRVQLLGAGGLLISTVLIGVTAAQKSERPERGISRFLLSRIRVAQSLSTPNLTLQPPS